MARTATKPKQQAETPGIDPLALPQAPTRLAPSDPQGRRQIAVHHMTRGLADVSDGGNFTADQLDNHCQTWLDRGYELLECHPTYIVPEQGPTGQVVSKAQWHILYLFAKYEDV